MRLSVLMTCYNRKEKTCECLRHLANCVTDDADIDIWLNDDGSTDGTSLAVQHWGTEHNTSRITLHVVRGSGSDYWCGGMRRAWNAAIMSGVAYDGYVWLNDDTMIDDDAIKELLATPGDIVCGAIRDPDSGCCSYGGYGEKGQLLVPNGEVQRAYRINGNVVLVRREAYNLIGTFRPCWTHAIGDGDYGLTANENGLTVVLTRKYIGTCRNDRRGAAWTNPTVSFAKRWKNLHSPLGYAEPRLFYLYNKLHFGFLVATRQLLIQYVRVLIPSIWRFRK